MRGKAVAGVVLVALSMAACGGSAEPRTSEDGAPAAEEPGVQAETVAENAPAVQQDTPPAAAQSGGQAGGMMGGQMSGQMGAMHEGMMGGQASPDAAPQPQPATAAAQGDCPKIDAALVAKGRTIFSGNGNCHTCHGPDAKGTPLAPDLTDTTWINIDGSYAAIDHLVTTGVPSPKEHPAPMPPKGGSSISADQVCQVAAYVYSLSHS